MMHEQKEISELRRTVFKNTLEMSSKLHDLRLWVADDFVTRSDIKKMIDFQAKDIDRLETKLSKEIGYLETKVERMERIFFFNLLILGIVTTITVILFLKILTGV